ncbi:hypothetical protein [Paraglaciecola sp.]|uniref:hypothetical protein n=1 Tax=Paraglaciecola sp. TaxID=1920173 RepID=UPI0030F453DB
MKKIKRSMPSIVISTVSVQQKNTKKMTYGHINKQLRHLLNDDSYYCVLGYN